MTFGLSIMKKLWITYAWADNEGGDIDFIAQELGKTGIYVRLDRWDISAGRRLWEQIENFITSEQECDGWLIVATQNSLSSQPCKEEIAYALDRTLKSRDGDFPFMVLFTGPVDDALIPASVKTRLFVSVTDQDWLERIGSALYGRRPEIARKEIASYEAKVHRHPSGKIILELRPRAGRWYPIIAAVPTSEKGAIKFIMVEPSGHPTGTGFVPGSCEEQSSDGKWAAIVSNQQATPHESLYVWFEKLPSQLMFGSKSGPLYTIDTNGL